MAQLTKDQKDRLREKFLTRETERDENGREYSLGAYYVAGIADLENHLAEEIEQAVKAERLRSREIIVKEMTALNKELTGGNL